MKSVRVGDLRATASIQFDDGRPLPGPLVVHVFDGDRRMGDDEMLRPHGEYSFRILFGGVDNAVVDTFDEAGETLSAEAWNFGNAIALGDLTIAQHEPAETLPDGSLSVTYHIAGEHEGVVFEFGEVSVSPQVPVPPDTRTIEQFLGDWVRRRVAQWRQFPDREHPDDRLVWAHWYRSRRVDGTPIGSWWPADPYVGSDAD